jgi:Asp-tRNA(Asn)/Glu-tRNA(Gln) amidotransferase A subunit family amidase
VPSDRERGEPGASPFVVRFDDAVGGNGALADETVVVKDSLDVAGAPTSLGMLDAGEGATEDAVIVARVRSAGGKIIAKTRMTELGMDGLGASFDGAVLRNPVSPGYFVGGSSTGTAVAVASGVARFGVGGDGLGSVRIPSAFCGLVGLKPGQERLPLAGYQSVAACLDVPGPITATAADCARLFQVLAGESPRELSAWTPDRVGIVDGLGPNLATRSIATAFERALGLLGCSAEPVTIEGARNSTMLATSIATGSIARSPHAQRRLTESGRAGRAVAARRRGLHAVCERHGAARHLRPVRGRRPRPLARYHVRGRAGQRSRAPAHGDGR